jgi:hypothetical protein
MREVAAESALECWHELAEDRIMSAWDFDDTYAKDACKDSNIDDDDAFIDIDGGHDDRHEIDFMMIVDRNDDKKLKQEKNGDKK